MPEEHFISIQEAADVCAVEVTVLREWAEYGIITVLSRGTRAGVNTNELRDIKRIAALSKDLGVNTEGIEIILSMRNRILELSRELAALRHELSRRQSDHKLRSLEIPRERGLIIDYFENTGE
jgi:DNA-binding transcriptional MerR regulator